VDDHLLSLDAKHLSLKKFLKECLKEETRTDVHRLFMWSWVGLASLALSFYKSYIRQDYKQKIVDLESDESFYRYNPNILEKEVRAYVDKINMINQHSN
jgi:hypothetical protein